MPERRDQLDWAEAYYEALESFCWEPQHLGRKKHPSVKFNSPDKTEHPTQFVFAQAEVVCEEWAA